jgi:phage gpG-like protein
MAVEIQVTTEGLREVGLWLAHVGMSPATVGRGLTNIAVEIVRDAAGVQIIRGGRGKNAGAPAANRLTSRNLGAGIVGSIRMNKTGLPNWVEVGSDKKYAHVHEFGGEFTIKTHYVREHMRTMAFGKKVKPFKVPKFFVIQHFADFPPRPFMKPALDKVVPHMPAIMLREWDKEVSRRT